MALTFRAAHIFTVEALAEVHEGYIDKLGNNARALRDKARAWLAAAKDNAETMRLAAANQTLKDEIASTNARMEAMEARMQEMLASAAPRRGRPPKDAEAA
jgi:seryl-tRNA synthetase